MRRARAGAIRLHYFYDTSAIYEFLMGNPAAKGFFVNGNGFVSLPVVMELYFVLLKNGEEEKANSAVERFFPLIQNPSRQTIVNAMKFRLGHEKLGLSYADALGYIYAKEHDMQFLTCDSAFKGLPSVVFLR